MNPDRAGRIPPPTRRLVVRKANSHRDLRPITERATLEKVLGLTVSRNACLACDPVSGLVAYPAGCVVVLFNPRKNKQSFVLNTSKKTITSVAFSGDGKYLATGESGHMPCVRVWDMEDQSHPQISEMAKGHKFGIACVAFSPNLKYVASVGFQHDMIVNIWNWKSGTKVASNKVSSKVSALSFSENGSFFVTVGVRHVKFWYFDTESNKSKVSKTLVINGRAALLGEQRNNTFCDVACGRGINSDITYCVTSSGLLCSINSKRVLDTWVELKSSKAHALAVSEHYIICGCADGIIRVFNPLKLQFIVTIPKPHFLGVNVAEGIDSSNPLSKSEKAVYPDAIAVALDTVNHRLACVYNDHSLYTWDVKDMKKIGKTWSSLFHSTCVWGVEVYPNVSDNRQAALPPGSFLTCSADDTVRVWNIEEGTSILFERNVYSKEMMKVLYMEDAVANLKDTDISPAIKNMRDSTGDTRNAGVRCLRISPDGQALATGDRSGNIRVYDLMFFDETAKIEAHESEVLCVEFSPTDTGHKLLASAGRDRLIHVFDMLNNFVLVQTLDDHSASITSIRFNMSESDELQLLSCGADKSIIFRTAQQNPEFQFVRTTNFVGKTTFYDMDIDPSGKLAATACQDRNVRVYDVNSGKQTRNYKGTQGDDGTLVRITLDSSGTYAATSCSDKSVCLTEFDSGECVASMSGHSEVVTGLKFSVDCKNLISVGGDGCIFLWKIPTTYMQNMVEKLQGLGQEPDNKIQFGTPIRRETYQMSHPSIIETPEEHDFVPAEPSAFTRPTREPSPPVRDYRFSVGQLPAWAKKQLVAEGNEKTSSSPEQDNTGPISQPGGRWAQRVQNGGIHVAGDNGTIQPIPFHSFEPADRKRYTIEPISLQEQVRALANSPLERRCSLTKGEDDDLFPADGRAALDKLSEDDEDYSEGIAPPGITVSRGSDVMAQVSRKSSIVMSEAGELKFEEAEELDEGEMKEVIIYLPPSQDDFDSEVASSKNRSSRGHFKYIAIFKKPQKANAPRVQEIVHHYEALQVTHHQSCPDLAQQVNKSLQDDLDEQDEPVKLSNPVKPAPLNRSPSLDYLPSRLQMFVRSFQLSAAQRPKRLSLTVEDPKGEEVEGKDKVEEKERKSPSSDDDEDEVISPSEDLSKPFGEDENKSEGGEDEELVGRYFESLGTSSPAQKVDEQTAEPPPLDTEKLMRTRLSISARFLSRSHQPGRLGTISTNLDEEKEDHRADDTKHDLQRRKEEMAQAVEATRKRLEALGWKAKEDILRKMPTSTTASSTNTVTSTSITTVVSSHSAATVLETSKTSILFTPTTIVTAVSKASIVTTSVSSTRTSAVTEGSKTNTIATSVSLSTPTPAVAAASTAAKGVDSTPVSSLSDSSSKPTVITNLLETRLAELQENQKEKEHKEKKEILEAKKEHDAKDDDSEKSKRSASHLIAFFSQSKSSKNKDKEKDNTKEKEKTKAKEKDKDKGRATPPLGKQTADTKSAAGGKFERRGSEGKSWRKSLGILGGSSKHDKEEKHKRYSDPRAATSQDVLTKNSQMATTKQDEKEDKSRKKQAEQRSSTPTAESTTTNSNSGTTKHGESSLKTVKEEKDKKLTKPTQSERRSSNPTAEQALKNSQSRVKTNETSSSSSKNVPLREKKGRVTGEERREKSRSLGDIGRRLHNIQEVSILDPSVPPSRTVDTMDIPDQLTTGEKRPKSSAGLLETTAGTSNTPSERNARDVNGTLKDNSHLSNGTSSDSAALKNTILDAAVPNNSGNSTKLEPSLDKKSLPVSPGSGNEALSAQGSTLEKKPNIRGLDSDVRTIDMSTSPVKNSRSGSGSRFMPDLSELSAELSAAIASPPPEPIRLSMSEANLLSTSSPPSSSRRSPIDGASTTNVDQSTCQETLENLVQAFQKVVDLQSRILNEEPSDESHEVLSYISSTFSAIEDQIHESRLRRRQWELSSLPRGKPGSGSRPLGGALSFSTGNLDQLIPKGNSLRRNSEFSVSSIPEDVEIHEVLLEKYSNRLLEMVAQKLSK